MIGRTLQIAARSATVRGVSCSNRKLLSCTRTLSSSTSLGRTESFTGVTPGAKTGKAEDAVNNILYNTPSEKEVEKRHIMSVIVDNSPGVLSKISGLLSARGFNIDSLNVSSTQVKELSRMTIVLRGPDTQIEQAGRQLEDLCDVWLVLDHAPHTALERELAIVKVSCHPPDTHRPDDEYDSLMQSQFHRQAVINIAETFGAEVHDVGTDSVILQLSSWSKRVDAFIRILSPLGVIEAARSGTIAMNRVPVIGGEHETEEEATKIDLADLPPS